MKASALAVTSCEVMLYGSHLRAIDSSQASMPCSRPQSTKYSWVTMAPVT